MESVVVFSGKDIQTMRQEGGSGHWPARLERVERCEYLIVVRNRREHQAATDLQHGSAFMIARIDEVVPSSHQNRVVIKFQQYAKLQVEDAWRILTNGQRFPVAYDWTSEILKRLRIDLNKLDWRSLHGAPQQKSLFVAQQAASCDVAGQKTEPAPTSKENPFAKAVAGAKSNLAESLGISVDAIEIIIRT